MLNRDADALNVDSDGLTPLHQAAFRNYANVASLLLERCDPDIASPGGITPLHLATFNSSAETATLLLAADANPIKPDDKGDTALHFAAEHNRRGMAELLLTVNDNVDLSNNSGYTPLHIAASKDHASLGELLLSNQANQNAVDKKGATPLHIAAKFGSLLTAKLLVEKKAKVSSVDDFGQSPLHYAATGNSGELANFLALTDADIDAVDNSLCTPLHLASIHNSTEAASILIKHDSSVDSTTEHGHTPLHLSAISDSVDITKLLLNCGAFIDATDTKGLTSLHHAASSVSLKTLSFLLKRKPEINHHSIDGSTPLHAAVLSNSMKAVNLLIDHGVELDVLDAKGRTPAEIASRRISNVIKEAKRQRDWLATEATRKQEAKLAEIAREELQVFEDAKARKIDEFAITQHSKALGRLKSYLRESYASVDCYFEEHCRKFLTAEDLDREKVILVKEWFTNRTNSSSVAIDDDQARAIGAFASNILVTARAGSGKTSTIINRALFLQERCGISPNEILILAFNRSAAQEIEERFTKLVELKLPVESTMNGSKSWEKLQDQSDRAGNPTLANFSSQQSPHVMTFHSLARAVVNPSSRILDENGQNRVIQSIIDGQTKDQDGQLLSDRLRAVMMLHFRKQWARLIQGGYDKNSTDFLSFRRRIPNIAMRGHSVRSTTDKAIADFLFEHGVVYKYERSHYSDGINYKPSFLFARPDGHAVVIEFVLNSSDNEYDSRSIEKRKYWNGNPDASYLEISQVQRDSMTTNQLRNHLKTVLEELGVRCQKLSEDQIFRNIPKRQKDSFTLTLRSFVTRSRKLGHSPDSLRSLVDQYILNGDIDIVEKDFLGVGVDLYSAYLQHIETTKRDDFDGLLQTATSLIRDGNTTFLRQGAQVNLKSIKHCFVDEYQDFSILFHEMLQAVRSQNDQFDTFCVGDDWQAINGFAGSDLRYFKTPKDFVAETLPLNIVTNYRSNMKIVESGNMVMKGEGIQSRAHNMTDAGRVEVADLAKFEPTMAEDESSNSDYLLPMVLRIVTQSIQKDSDVVLLAYGRTFVMGTYFNGGLFDFLKQVQRRLPEEFRSRVTASTVHSYKGLESSTVIILDGFGGNYPFINPNWVFNRVFGDSIESLTADGKRLFYVASTRAISNMFIVTDSENPSTLLEQIQELPYVDDVDWNGVPPVDFDNDQLWIKIGNQTGKGSVPTLAIKESLKSNGYAFGDFGWSCWYRKIPAENFTIQLVKNESWPTTADGIEVRVADGADNVISRYIIDNGQWEEIEALVPQVVRNEHLAGRNGISTREDVEELPW